MAVDCALAFGCLDILSPFPSQQDMSCLGMANKVCPMLKGCLGATEESQWMTGSLERDQNLTANELQGKDENRHNEQSFIMAF